MFFLALPLVFDKILHTHTHTRSRITVNELFLFLALLQQQFHEFAASIKTRNTTVQYIAEAQLSSKMAKLPASGVGCFSNDF